MIHTLENCKNKVLVDANGIKVPYVYEFNDETLEAKFYVKDSSGKFVINKNSYGSPEVATGTAVIPGARLVDKSNNPST